MGEVPGAWGQSFPPATAPGRCSQRVAQSMHDTDRNPKAFLRPGEALATGSVSTPHPHDP